MTRVLLDTDLGMGSPGTDIDDGFALALALADPELTVELVTTVNGNTGVHEATRLTRDLLRSLGRDQIEVVPGCAEPLLRASGRSRPGAEPARVHAAAALIDRLLREPGELTVVAIGPLTNLALALILEPAIAAAVREIVVMGGCYLGQTGVAAMPGEFNFWCDPEAATVVLDSGASLRLVGLDVTRRVRLRRSDAARLRRVGGRFGSFAADCTESWIDHLDRTVPGDLEPKDSCALHDPLAVAAVARPQLLTWRPARVCVERAGEHTRGVAVTDLLATEHPPSPNCSIAVDVDVEGFRGYFLDRIGSLP